MLITLLTSQSFYYVFDQACSGTKKNRSKIFREQNISEEEVRCLASNFSRCCHIFWLVEESYPPGRSSSIRSSTCWCRFLFNRSSFLSSDCCLDFRFVVTLSRFLTHFSTAGFSLFKALCCRKREACLMLLHSVEIIHRNSLSDWPENVIKRTLNI